MTVNYGISNTEASDMPPFRTKPPMWYSKEHYGNYNYAYLLNLESQVASILSSVLALESILSKIMIKIL